MRKQKLRSVMMLCLLFLLGMVYCAHIFVVDSKVATQTELTETSDDTAESGEENVKETSHHLFLLEKMRYQMKPIASISLNFCDHVQTTLPTPYLQLSTPPPNFA